MSIQACGDVEFIPSPYSVQKLALSYSIQEDVTLLSWKLGPRIDSGAVRFELKRENRWEKLDFGDAPFLSGSFSCGQDTCFRYFIPGKFQFSEDDAFLRSVHGLHGEMHAAPVGLKELDSSLSFAPTMVQGNGSLDLAVDDALSEPGTPLRRPYRWAVQRFHEECPAKKPSEVSWSTTSKGKERVRLEEKPQEKWCVWLSPVSDSHPAVSLVQEVRAHPELNHRRHRYIPPMEEAPVVWKTVFDLEIPSDSRCGSTVQLFEDAFKKALRKRDPHAHQLPTLFLSGKSPEQGNSCRQDPLRRLPASEIAEEAKEHLRLKVQNEAGSKVLLVYANNSGLPLSPVMVDDWMSVQVSIFNQPKSHSLLLNWASAAVLASLPMAEGRLWLSPSHPSFSQKVEAFAEDWLPFTSMLHENDEPVFFLGPDLAAKEGWVKLCSSTPEVKLWSSEELEPGTFIFPSGPSQAVGYLVELERQWLVPHHSYVEHEVRVRYEHCSAWCSHPFRASSGEWLPSWLESPLCSEGM